jgi:hypothetical protein
MTATTPTHRDSKNPVPIPVEDAIAALNNFRRRQVILLTADATEMPTVSDLAEQIAATENDCPTDQLTAQQRKRVYISLIQTHLKKLDRAGVIHYHEPAKAVAPTEATAPLADCICALHEMCRP